MNGKNEGIHGVLVPIRDSNLVQMPGVLVEDMGHKMGMNGVDNAKLTFDHVRVPRKNLLNKFSGLKFTNCILFAFFTIKDHCTLVYFYKHKFKVCESFSINLQVCFKFSQTSTTTANS